jgi:hypothetical protein
MIITRQNMIDFIMSQPDDKPVDFRGNHIDAECYCPMMEYAIQNNIRCDEAGTWTLWDKGRVAARLPQDTQYSDFKPENPKTYSDLKKHLMNKGWL